MNTKKLVDAFHYFVATVGQLALLVATASGIWLLFPADDPSAATSWFLFPYNKIYLPALAISSVVVFSMAVRKAYVGLEEYVWWLVAAAGVGTIAVYQHIADYPWPAGILAVSVAYLVWLFVAVPKEQRAVQQKALIGARASATEEDQAAIRFPAIKAKADFQTVVGMTGVKQRLQEAGAEVTTSLKTRQAARNGILLYGEPGNGKTFIAEALAGELGLPIIKASFGDVVSKWVGETSESVRQLFDEAAKQAPCVLFIDEIDSLIRDRNASMGGGNSEEAKTTNILLTGLVSIRTKGVVVVAATNYLDKLDGAAIREGRFDFKIEIPAPDAAARSHLIKSAVFAHKGYQLTQAALLQAIKRWEGFSVVRIRSAVEEACRQAKKDRNPWIDYSNLQAALRTIQGKQGDVIPENTPSLEEVRMDGEQSAKLLSIAHRMRHIEEIEALGGSVPTGVLFYGPPGTGKTMTVRALAKSSGWVLKSVSGTDLVADTKKIDEITNFAKQNRPCIIFIDEADDVLSHRGMSGGSASLLTNKLLAAIDGAKGKVPDVVWIAATNHPDSLDEAALRGGRFTEKIGFSAPDASTAAALIDDWIARSTAKFDSAVVGRAAAVRLEGESPANIKAILQQAVNLMIERKIRLGFVSNVTLDDISEARLIVSGEE